LLGSTGKNKAKTAVSVAVEAKPEVEIWQRPKTALWHYMAGPLFKSRLQPWRRASSWQISSKSTNPLQRYWDFSRWQPSAILDLFRAYFDHPHRLLGGLYHCAKFGCKQCSSFDNMKVSIFATFVSKTPIQVPKNWRFWTIWPWSWVEYQRNSQKAYPCVSQRYFSHQMR